MVQDHQGNGFHAAWRVRVWKNRHDTTDAENIDARGPQIMAIDNPPRGQFQL
jgi:uncharacterized protein YfaP (DUF2135 family)